MRWLLSYVDERTTETTLHCSFGTKLGEAAHSMVGKMAPSNLKPQTSEPSKPKPQV